MQKEEEREGRDVPPFRPYPDCGKSSAHNQSVAIIRAVLTAILVVVLEESRPGIR